MTPACVQRNEAAASWGRSGSPKGRLRKAALQTSGDLADPHLEAVSQPAHTSRKTGPHFTVSHILPWLLWSPFSLPLGVRRGSRLIDLHELMCSPHSSAPAPSWATANSRKQPKGTRTSSAGGGVGSISQHSGQAHFHTDVFCHKLGGVAKPRVRRVPNDKAWEVR